MITNLEKLKKEYGFDFLSFYRNRITNMVEVKAGKFKKNGASKGIWIDVEDSLLVPGYYKIKEIDDLTGKERIIRDKKVTKEITKKNLKVVMRMLKKQYEKVMEDGTFDNLEDSGLVQSKGFEYETKR